MAIVLVQKGGVQASASASPVTANWSPGGSSTAGNLIAMLIGSYTGTAGTNTVTDQAGGNAFTRATTIAWNATWGLMSEVWYLPNCPSGITGVRVANAASGFQPTIGIAEFSGCLTVSPLGPTATATGNSTAANSGNVTPADNGSLIFGGGLNAGFINGSSQTNAVGSGFTADYNPASGSAGMAAIAEHLVQATAAAIAATFQPSSAIDWWAHAVVFKPAAGGGAAFVARPPYVVRQAVRRAAYY